MAGRRWLLLVLVALALSLRFSGVRLAAFSAGAAGAATACRRQWLQGSVLGLVIPPALAEEGPPLGSIPKDLKATAVGEKVTTPNGCVYEPLDLGTEETGPRSGPPRGGANVQLKYTARLESFSGPIFDSSELRGKRKPNKVDFVESRLNVDPSLPNCVFEAVKLMKVGAKGRAMCPGKLSYSEGKVAFDADEEGEVKKIPAGASLYYELELLRIIKP
ncbi:unnamed protein product [Durusdinium trenchii]|eukprot:g6231.t1